ncbi:MAG: winged helix-turn-helix transcriptional regulator [Gammaproteobacteria bacterium]
MNGNDREESLTLSILETIEGRSDLTQRHLADHLGIALGLANSYLKRCTRKGLIKIQQAPANRYLYYLTPRGFAEKSRLTARYLSASLLLYRRASADYGDLFRGCSEQGVTRVVLCGVSELAEIAILRAHEWHVVVLGVCAFTEPRPEVVVGYPVWPPERERYERADALVLTSLADAGTVYRQLLGLAPLASILLPRCLEFARDASAPESPMELPRGTRG